MELSVCLVMMLLLDSLIVFSDGLFVCLLTCIMKHWFPALSITVILVEESVL